MLSPEIIYQHLQNKQYGSVITLLHENGNILNTDPSVDFAINIFMNAFFVHIQSADEEALKELHQDLDLLYVLHTEGNYRLKDEQAIPLIHLLIPRQPRSYLYKGAKDFPDDTKCKKIIDWYTEQQKVAEKERQKPYKPAPVINSKPALSGQKFDTQIGHGDYTSWVKVYLRSAELLNTVASHIRKVRSVGKVNITPKDNGRNDLTIYAQRPFSIEEVQQEVELILENYFSRSPADPIFKESVISGISDVAYFEVLDYMLKLGVGLEGFKSLSTKMDEERYRDYFVNFLDSLSNNHTVTGETFHGVGKTDILIRNREKEVLMVAECKLWKGNEYLRKAIDQLFERYVVWRDGKAALMIFNTKVAAFTKLMESSIATVSAHPLCISYEGKRKETSYSFIFRNYKDPDKTIRLELVLFNFV